MPARELGSSFDAPNGAHALGTTLLKRHKILPHPREEPAPTHYPSPPVQHRVLAIDTGVSSKPAAEAPSPRTLKHTSKRIGGLPPTPPTHSRQSSGHHPVVPSTPRFDVKPAAVLVTPRTPPNQRSPPTPDVTPPRGMPLAFRTPFRPVLSDRYPSSRTDSFKTAPENPYSSGEDDEDVSTVRPVLPSARASELTIIPQLPERSVRRKEVGLGLGLESEGTSTPRPREKSPQEAFVVFDGEWSSPAEEVSEVEREWDDNLMRNVTVRKRPGRNKPVFTDGAADEVVEDNIVSPTIATRVARSLPLQERIARHRLQRDTADRTSTEKFAQAISWPNEVPDPESPVSPGTSKRISTMSAKSGFSTVIDAMVVDTPVQRQKTLRHTKKHLGLRDFSSEYSTASSAPTSVISSDPPHRLVRKAAGIPRRRHQSLNSSTTISTASSSGKSRREVINNGGIPVVVIPDRRSSSKGPKTPSLRSTSSHRTRSNSLSSAPLSQSAKFNEPGYFDMPRHKRTMSDSAGSAGSERTMDFPPKIPVRRSSLSAPTSRNTSRAGSLTAESLKAHNIQQQARRQESSKPVEATQNQANSSPESHRGRSKSSVDHNGDPFFGNRLSAQATPFSQASYETTGTAAEVSEAMMVNIFPHQNKSVLVVQHENSPIESSSKDSELPKNSEKDAFIQPPTQPTMAVNDEPTTGPVTPPQPIHPMDSVDSPLRNPRAPPVPPAIKFIPPTPAGLTPGHEEERQLGYDPNEVRPTTSDDKPKRGLSIVRRALSKRRNSESAVSTGSILRETFLPHKKRELTDEATQTSKGEANPSTLYPTVTDQPPDGSKLHPFWRPTNFWDDLEDRENEDYEDDEYDDEYGRYPIIDNRPGPPKRSLSNTLKRTFAILPIQDENHYASEKHPTQRRTMRRSASGNMKVVKQRSQSSLRRGASSPPATRYRGPVLKEGDFGYGFKEGNGGKRENGYIIPGLGLRVEYVGWGGVKRKIREKRRAQRSDKLRGTISSPRGVRSGIDDVLRRRSQIGNVH
ncbi:hypothetical protein PVAG01_03833 [Phlyctema vagabunda]|uniref:Uncharacterized protein n=1 Tax=Phlyctema vagabunda TaxID=108571 RepID=A0ABR4PN70_9HELO